MAGTQMAPKPIRFGAVFDEARKAQAVWSRTPMRDRLAVVRKTRDAIAANAEKLLACFPRTLMREESESLTCEIIPLAEACRFLELRATDVLATQKLSSTGRPVWLRGVAVEVHREPFGVVLIIGPGNYPLFLPGVQALQAMVAGNAVLLKPGAGGRPVMEMFARLMHAAGLPRGLFVVLDESIQSASEAIECGADKVIFTGSVQSGRAVLSQAAERPVPAVAELSGFDAVFVQSSANVRRAAEAVSFGRALNGGATCIAPRRVFVHRSVAREFRKLLADPDGISITDVDDDEDALRAADGIPYALSATIFGDEVSARRLAVKVHAGVVVINDVIVPTADPRVPFGGRGWSGFGTTRGAEGLLEMTALKAVIVQRAKRLRHLETPPPNAQELFLSYLSARHRLEFRDRWNGLRRLRDAMRRTRKAIEK